MKLLHFWPSFPYASVVMATILLLEANQVHRGHCDVPIACFIYVEEIQGRNAGTMPFSPPPPGATPLLLYILLSSFETCRALSRGVLHSLPLPALPPPLYCGAVQHQPGSSKPVDCCTHSVCMCVCKTANVALSDVNFGTPTPLTDRPTQVG